MTAVFSFAIGAGISTASRTEGSPKASNRIAHDLVLQVIICRSSPVCSVFGGLSITRSVGGTRRNLKAVAEVRAELDTERALLARRSAATTMTLPMGRTAIHEKRIRRNRLSSLTLPAGFKDCANLRLIDGEIPRDLIDCEAHFGERV
jgi:hypothetical protein